MLGSGQPFGDLLCGWQAALRPVLFPLSPFLPPNLGMFGKRTTFVIVKCTTSPASHPLPPPKRPIVPTDRPIAPTDRPIPPPKRPIPPPKRSIAPAKRPMVPTKRPIVPTDRPMVPTKRPIVPTDRPIVPTDRPIAPAKHPVPPSFRLPQKKSSTETNFDATQKKHKQTGIIRALDISRGYSDASWRIGFRIRLRHWDSRSSRHRRQRPDGARER